MGSVKQGCEKAVDTVFALFEKHFYENPRNLVILSASILLSINIYFSVVQLIKGGFIEVDMWFFAYRIEEMADNGIGVNLFVAPTGTIDTHPPFYYMVTVPMRLMGLSVLWIAAILRVIIPVAAVYFTYKITELLFGKTEAAVACFFVALMPPNPSYHGLWTSTPSAVSLIPFLAGVYATVKFAQSYKSKWFLSSVILFLVASFTHFLTAFASFIFMGCAFFFFRKKISKLSTVVTVLIFAGLAAYGLYFISSITGSQSLLDLKSALTLTFSAKRASALRQFYFIAYWPRHLTLIACVSFLVTVYSFYTKKFSLKTVDKVFFTWMALLAVYSQLFLVGIYLANQRFILYLMVFVAVYGAKGFTKLMPLLTGNTVLKFSFFASIFLFSFYQTGITLGYFPIAIGASDIKSLEEMKEYIPEDAVVYVEKWFYNARYEFAYITGCTVLFDNSVNDQIEQRTAEEIKTVLTSQRIEYLVVSPYKAREYQYLFGDNVTVIWENDRFSLLQYQT